MRIFKTILFFCLLSLTQCISDKERSVKSEEFYKKFKDSFLKSDLTKFNYDPHTCFTFGDYDSANFYKVIIYKDSSIRVIGTEAFSKLFNVQIDNFCEDDVIVSKSDTNYILIDPYNNKKNKTINNTADTSLNVVDYFLELKNLILKYQILEIKKHPQVNTTKIVFSSNDYLIYKPDSLKFKSSNKEFMKYLFQNGKEIDKNWVQFTYKTNTDYY